MLSIKEHVKNELIIIWNPKKCIHAGICATTLLPEHNPKEKPWIKPEGTLITGLMHQIDNCPSGALSYREP